MMSQQTVAIGIRGLEESLCPEFEQRINWVAAPAGYSVSFNIEAADNAVIEGMRTLAEKLGDEMHGTAPVSEYREGSRAANWSRS
jgi:hypothetical protein